MPDVSVGGRAAAEHAAAATRRPPERSSRALARAGPLRAFCRIR
jgi:hypothetical protein